MFSGSGGRCYLFSVGQKKQESRLGSPVWLKPRRATLSSYVPRHWLSLATCLSLPTGRTWPGVCSVSCVSFCKDIARKADNKGKVLRESKCGCYGDVLCCE